MTNEQIEIERARFERVFKIPEQSRIQWVEQRDQYCTSFELWKKHCHGLNSALEGWLAAKQDAAEQIN